MGTVVDWLLKPRKDRVWLFSCLAVAGVSVAVRYTWGSGAGMVVFVALVPVTVIEELSRRRARRNTRRDAVPPV